MVLMKKTSEYQASIHRSNANHFKLDTVEFADNKTFLPLRVQATNINPQPDEETLDRPLPLLLCLPLPLAY